MSDHRGIATGKIIVSGEYAMVFGHPGIAFPSTHWCSVTWKRDRKRGLEIEWPDVAQQPLWRKYLQAIAKRCNPRIAGTLHVENYIPLGKGMGSSTALLVATCKALLGEDCKETALAMENEVNPGNSGMDFAVIWERAPIYFRKGHDIRHMGIPGEVLEDALLIDTGMPNEATPELVAWVKSRMREPGVANAIEAIGGCTERLAKGEALRDVMRDHHKAQLALGVVPPHVASFVAAIERSGGSAKVIGAGGRTGGGGMVLALHDTPAEIHKLIEPEPDWVLPARTKDAN